MLAPAIMPKKSRPVDTSNRLGWCALAAGVVHAWPGPSAQAAPVRLSVPFRTDQSITASTMAMEWQAEDLGGRSVRETLQATAHPSAAVMKRWVDHLAAGQAIEAAALLKPGAFQSPEDGQSYASNFVASFRNALPDATLRRRFDVGAESWFSWEVAMDGKPINRVTRFSEQGGVWLWSDELRPSTTRSMQTLLSAAEQLLADNQPGARAVETMEFQHAVPVPGVPARWLFNGFSTSWDAFGNGPVPDHPVTRTYASAVQSLYQGDFEAFAAAHLPFSAQRLRDSVAQMDNAQKAEFAESVRQAGRKVTFVLDASPIFLVFYESDGRGLQYDTLVASGSDQSKIQFCNFFFEGFIDEILKDRGFFHDPVIRPLAGRLQDPVAPAVAAADPTNPTDPSDPTDLSTSPAPPTRPEGPATLSPTPNRLTALGWGGLILLLAILAIVVFRLCRSKP